MEVVHTMAQRFAGQRRTEDPESGQQPPQAARAPSLSAVDGDLKDEPGKDSQPAPEGAPRRNHLRLVR